jgi:hypothetical protein
MIRISMAAFVLVAIIIACTKQSPPLLIQLSENTSSKAPRAAESKDAIRWEGEDEYFFTEHTPIPASGIMTNPKAFIVYLNNMPIKLSVAVDNKPAVRINADDTPDTSQWQYAYQLRVFEGGDPNNANDLRNHLYISPAQKPMLLDHNRLFTVSITDMGGNQQSAPPITSKYKFRFVAPDRCKIGNLSANKSEVDPDTTVNLKLNINGDCKLVWITSAESGGGIEVPSPGFPSRPPMAPSDPILYNLYPGIGKSTNITVPYLIGKHTSFSAVAFDAAGKKDSRSFSVKLRPKPSTPPAPPAPECPKNSDGLPLRQSYCISCPSGFVGKPYKSTIIGDYCNEESGISDLKNQFGNCEIKAGQCL